MKRLPFPGEALRAKRDDMGLTVEDVYRKLRIPVEIVEAFESGQLDSLPTMTYAIGFLRTYCVLLELDPDCYTDALRESTRPATNFLGLPSGGDAVVKPAWWNEATAWAAITAILVLGWVTYSVLVQPASDRGDSQVQADTLEFIDAPSQP